jgi:hypothetical protein
MTSEYRYGHRVFADAEKLKAEITPLVGALLRIEESSRVLFMEHFSVPPSTKTQPFRAKYETNPVISQCIAGAEDILWTMRAARIDPRGLDFRLYPHVLRRETESLPPVEDIEVLNRLDQGENNCFLNSLLYAMFVGSTAFDSIFDAPAVVDPYLDAKETVVYESFMGWLRGKVLLFLRDPHPGSARVRETFNFAEYETMALEIIDGSQLSEQEKERIRFNLLGIRTSEGAGVRGLSAGDACASDEMFLYLWNAVLAVNRAPYSFDFAKCAINHYLQITSTPVSADSPLITVDISALAGGDNSLLHGIRDLNSWIEDPEAAEAQITATRFYKRVVPLTIPKALIVAVNRKRIDRDYDIRTVADIPLGFQFKDLFDHTADESVLTTANIYPHMGEDEMEISYQLFSIILWHKGHYVANVRAPGTYNTWWKLDGARANVISAGNPVIHYGENRTPSIDNPSTNGVMFFYERIDK